MRRTALFGTIALASAAGCYAYVPVARPAPPRAGERVRVALTLAGTTELARFLGPRVAVAEGDLTRIRDDSSLVVGVDFVQHLDGTRQPWTGEGMVTIPSSYVEQVRQRTFQRRQTVVATVAASVAVVGAAIAAFRVAGAGSGPGGGGPPPPP